MQILTNTITAVRAPFVQEQAELDTACKRLRNGPLAPALDELFEDLKAQRGV